jgi:hypothetical protein
MLNDLLCYPQPHRQKQELPQDDAAYYQERRRAKEPWPCTSWLGPVVVFDVCRLDHTRTPKLPLGVIVQHGASPVERGESAYPPRLSVIADIPGSAALCRYCCKSPKLPGDNFSAVRRFARPPKLAMNCEPTPSMPGRAGLLHGKIPIRRFVFFPERNLHLPDR